MPELSEKELAKLCQIAKLKRCDGLMVYLLPDDGVEIAVHFVDLEE